MVHFTDPDGGVMIPPFSDHHNHDTTQGKFENRKVTEEKSNEVTSDMSTTSTLLSNYLLSIKKKQNEDFASSNTSAFSNADVAQLQKSDFARFKKCIPTLIKPIDVSLKKELQEIEEALGTESNKEKKKILIHKQKLIQTQLIFIKNVSQASKAHTVLSANETLLKASDKIEASQAEPAQIATPNPPPSPTSPIKEAASPEASKPEPLATDSDSKSRITTTEAEKRERIAKVFTAIIKHAHGPSSSEESREEAEVLKTNITSIFELAIRPIQELKYKGTSYIIKTNEIGVEILCKGQFLAAGSFTDIFEYTNIESSAASILKTPRKSTVIKDKPFQDLNNEKETLDRLHSEPKREKITGLISPPHLISSPTGEKGYLMKKYSTNFDKVVSNPRRIPNYNEVMYEHLYQLFKGVQFLHRHDTVHGDLKPANLLVDGRTLDIADLGGARQTSEIKQKEIHWFMLTSPYVARNDMFQLQQIAMSIKSIDGKRTGASILQKVDVFAVGKILYEAFERRSPFLRSQEGYADGNYIEMTNTSIPPELGALIKEMLNLEHQHRPTIDEAFAKFKAILKNTNPDLLKQLDEKYRLA